MMLKRYFAPPILCVPTYLHTPKSLVIQPSVVGHIAKAMALIGNGEGETAIRLFDLVFGHCDSDDNKILLVIKVPSSS